MASMLLNVRVCITTVASSVCASVMPVMHAYGSAAYGVAYLNGMTCHNPLRV